MSDFTGFRFGNTHSKDLHLLVVSSNSRYTKETLPEQKDYTSEVTGRAGALYFGSSFDIKEFTVNVAFDSIDERTWRKISQLFATDKLQDLVFDELPYKTYRAKIKGKPQFTTICFKNRETGERTYKGEGTLNFICYFPFAFGFDKYIVRAADYYLTTPPQKIIEHSSIYEHPYKKQEQIIYNRNTKEYYNVENNMGEPWKGGYPTIEQVQAGELYFNTPNGEKSIIDVRGYWDNVPKWASSSELLTTPTLDNDQELIFMPQFSKFENINMDIGICPKNNMLGSRMLVYNPGDMPIDFQVKINFPKGHGRLDHFQIRRLNVQRLTIPQAVDWTGLKAINNNDNIVYKYGDKYFKRRLLTTDGEIQYYDIAKFINESAADLSEDELKEHGYYCNAHPTHVYIAEPIPKQLLDKYIVTFFWQSWGEARIEEGKMMADRYRELLDLCLYEEEENELYWNTLKNLFKIFRNSVDEHFYDSFEDFFEDYIYNPPEFIVKDSKLKYGEDIFNIFNLPNYYTTDYLEMEGLGEVQNIESLNLDFCKEMVYNINIENNSISYKQKKTVLNDYITKGIWFKIPKGWSLIEVLPVADDYKNVGKTWNDARPFDWGYGGEKKSYDKKAIQEHYDNIYNKALSLYFGEIINDNGEYDYKNGICKADLLSILNITDLTISNNDLYEKAIKFRLWFEDKKEEYKFVPLMHQYYYLKEYQYEIEFLKTIQMLWSLNTQGIYSGEIDEWWWYACNYIWANFPPVYWGYADILNRAKIEYIPLFY